MRGMLRPEGNLHLLRQGLRLLETLTDPQYLDRRGGWAPVGAQYRHILDHYLSFLRGLPIGRVDYDARTRDPTLEINREAAGAATRDCLAALKSITGGADRSLEVRMDCGEGGGASDWRASSAGRELQFLVSHTVHHFALIQLLLEGSGIPLDPEFGTAPSTLAHQRAVSR